MGRHIKNDNADDARMHLRARQRENQKRCVEKKRADAARLEAEINDKKKKILDNISRFSLLREQTLELIQRVRNQTRPDPYVQQELAAIEQTLTQKYEKVDEGKRIVDPDSSSVTPPTTRKSTRTKAVDQSVPNYQ